MTKGYRIHQNPDDAGFCQKNSAAEHVVYLAIMTEDLSNTTVEQLLERLAATPDHDRFVGAPVDIAGLTPLEYGRLWPAL